MSKFTAKPYIETILGEVSGENKAKLLNFINGKGADGTGEVSYTLCSSIAELNELSAGITPIAYKYSSTIVWKGYFIRTTNHKAFVTYKNGIDLWLASIYKVDANGIYPIEKCTADNIRALLREDSYIDVSELPTPEAELPEAPADASTKIYVLKLVNGVKTWVEEVVVEDQASEPAVEGE